MKTAMRLTYRIARAERDMRQSLDRALRPFDITLMSWAVLSHIVREPGISVVELTRGTFITQQAVSKILAALEHERRIKRTPQPSDGRKWKLLATASGRRLAAACDQRVMALEDLLREALGDDSARMDAMLVLSSALFESFARTPK